MTNHHESSDSATPSPRRLVIRVRIPDGALSAPVQPPRVSKGALLLILIAVAVALSWLVISLFKTDPAPAPLAVGPSPAPTPREAAPAVSAAPLPEVQPQPPTPLTPIKEVIPDPSRSALNTISGTIRVSVRVTIDKEGKVLDATTIVPGPSRYFARLAVEAAKKWTFTPTNSEEQRSMLLWFNFRRSGATAEAESLQN